MRPPEQRRIHPGRLTWEQVLERQRMKSRDLWLGRVYGKLRVIAITIHETKHVYCLCECGEIVRVLRGNLIRGLSKACTSGVHKNKRTVKTLDELLSRTITTRTGCMEWQGALGATEPFAYGALSIAGRMTRAHRYAWELANNATVPEGMIVMHKCDNPKCVNPDHLMVGTHKDNFDDMVSKGRDRLGGRPSIKEKRNA